MEKLIIIADLGHIRSLELRTASDDPQERDHLVKHSEITLEDQVMSRGEVVTDKSGRFGQGGGAGGAGGMSYGEEHNLASELQRKALENLAERIAELVSKSGNPDWILVAPKPILPRLQKGLPKACQACLSETVGGNLTKVSHAKLERRFLNKG